LCKIQISQNTSVSQSWRIKKCDFVTIPIKFLTLTQETKSITQRLTVQSYFLVFPCGSEPEL
jgi:hypothetical protein